MNLQELIEKRAKLVQQSRELLDRVEAEERELAAEEEEHWSRINAEIDDLRKKIERQKRQAELEEELRQRQHPNPPKPEVTASRAEGDYMQRAEAARSTDEYRQAFWQLVRRGERTITREQAEVLYNQELRALQVGTATEGGNLVPTDFERKLIEIMREANIMRQLADVITASHDRQIPTVTTLPTATWIAEEGAYQENDPAFGQITLSAYKAGAIVKVSEELLQDSAFPLDSELARLYGDASAALEEAAFVNGDGSGKPTGVVQGASAGITAAGATAITADELIDLYHSLKRVYRRRAAFLAEDATIKAVRKLKDGNNQYLWQPGLANDRPDTLLGRPIYAADDMPSMTTGQVSMLFGDFRYYRVMDRKGFTVQRLDELYAANGQVGFRFHHRTDGKLTLSEAVKKLTQA